MKAAFRQGIARLFEHQVRRLIKHHHVRVVAVAGSVGKTSTRAAVTTMLRQKYSTQSITQPGYNSEIGLPLSVFEMSVPGILMNPFAWLWRLLRAELIISSRYPHQLLVLELGTDHPGEIAHYLRYLTPDIGIITAITPEHMENFPGGMDQVAAEELQLATASKQVLSSHDIDPKYRRHYIDSHPRHYYYALGTTADYGLKIGQSDPVSGTTATIYKNGHPAGKPHELKVYGEPLAKAALAAYAAGDMFDLTANQLTVGLAAIRPVPGRLNPLAGQNGSIILDDSYNSSPDATVAALDALAKVPHANRRLAILGSMNELGPESPQYHEAMGAAAVGLDWLVTLGPDANQYLGPAAVRAGLDPTRLQAAESPTAAGLYIALILQPGDVVLVKGSQNQVFAEEAIKQFLADPADSCHLVRQSKNWLRIKSKQFPDTK